MQTISEEITTLKKQLGAQLCVMGHHYQNDAVVRHCDITGDSLELARRVPGVDARGALCLRLDDGSMRRIDSAEVTVRRA